MGIQCRYAIPNKKKLLEKIRIIISDGDTQFFSQIDNAIQPYFKNAKRIRYGWYLIHKGWERHVDTASQFTNVSLQEYRDIKKILTARMTSWMKGLRTYRITRNKVIPLWKAQIMP